MKRFGFLVIAAILMLSACTSLPAQSSTVPPAAVETASPAQTDQPTLAPTATPEPAAETSATKAAGSFSADDIKFAVDGQAFELKCDISALLAKLGKGYTVSEAVSCVYEGMDKTFAYPGISIYTFPTKGVDY